MKKEEFITIRKKLEKTQQQIAQLLGVSVKAVHSYEQGWRRIPDHVERQMLFLISRRHTKNREIACWEMLDCPDEKKKKCPAWEFKSGKECWFVNGTFCSGEVYKTWKEKITICRKCIAFISKLP